MKYDEEKVRELMSELVLALPGYSPLEIPQDSSHAMERFALASMYKEIGYRNYIIRSIRQNIERFQDVRDMYSLGVQQGRVLVLKELLALSKQMFQEADKIDKSINKSIEENNLEVKL